MEEYSGFEPPSPAWKAGILDHCTNIPEEDPLFTWTVSETGRNKETTMDTYSRLLATKSRQNPYALLADRSHMTSAYLGGRCPPFCFE